MSNAQAELAFYKAVALKKRPPWVPATVMVLRKVRSDLPTDSRSVEPGVYACECNQWGAVSVRADNGGLLGLLPAEFKVKTWREVAALAERTKGTP